MTTRCVFWIMLLVSMVVLAAVSLGSADPFNDQAGHPDFQPPVTDDLSIVGWTDGMVVLRTTDGGYRCIAEAEFRRPETASDTSDSISDARAVRKALEICLRLKDIPSDDLLLDALAQVARTIDDHDAFCHYVAIYYLGCLSVGRIREAEFAWHAISNRDPDNRYLDILAPDVFIEPCPTCGRDSEREDGKSSVSCSACDGSGRKWKMWKIERVYREMLLDGNMQMIIVQTEAARTSPPPTNAESRQPETSEAPHADMDADTPRPERDASRPESVVSQPTVVTPHQVKRDRSLWGKPTIVRGRVSQVVRRMGGYWFVILDGHLRCRLRKNVSASSCLQGRQVFIKGTVVPRPDKAITASPHMIDCMLRSTLSTR